MCDQKDEYVGMCEIMKVSDENDRVCCLLCIVCCWLIVDCVLLLFVVYQMKRAPLW